MPRKPRQAKMMKRPLAAWEIAYLSDQLELIEPGSSEAFDYHFSDWNPKKLWRAYRDEFLPKWISKHPCTRPSPWWDHDAPRWLDDPWPGCFIHGKLAQPRKRLGGIGTAKFEVLAYAPSFTKGIPDGWITELDVRIHGKIGKVIDPEDPPTYESEAAYLKRHGLLTPGEIRHLEKRPELLEPEIVRLDDEN